MNNNACTPNGQFADTHKSSLSGERLAIRITTQYEGKKCGVNVTVGQCQCLLPRSDAAGEKGERQLLGGDCIPMWATT